MQAKAAVGPVICTMREAIGEEYKEYIKKLGTVDHKSNPMDWWDSQLTTDY